MFVNTSLLKEAMQPYYETMLQAERDIWAHPETGYREWYAHGYLKELFEEMGYDLTLAGNIPGFYTDLDSGNPGPTIAVMAELDSVLCANHPESNSETSAVHACGHHAQCAALLGIAYALRDPRLLSRMHGKIRFVAVPAEELLELGYRAELKKQGIIRYFGGKVEFMYRGYFDDVDVALMVHTTGSGNGLIGFPLGSNGCLSKTIKFEGKAAHAGGAPHEGINAFYAATLGINAINALRETMQDNDHIRIHPIMISAGAAVNVIPESAELESYVRGASLEAMVEANEKVNRALAASAAAMGANVTLSDLMGYFPLHPDKNFHALAYEYACHLVGKEEVNDSKEWGTGCTDMGDVASVIPSLHPYVSGAIGTGHGADYYIENPEEAVILSAEFQSGLIYTLLCNKAKHAYAIKENANLQFESIADYFEMADSIEMERQAVAYEKDGSATLRWKK